MNEYILKADDMRKCDCSRGL